MPPKKEGLPTWAKIAIGCGCLVLIIILVGVMMLGWGGKKLIDKYGDNPESAVVGAMIDANPDLELVESGDGKMTVRNVKTGEVGTFDYSDIKNGNLSFETSEGSYSIDADGDGEGGMVIKTPEGETRVTANEKDGMTISGPDGDLRIGGGMENVPAWVPLYDGAEWQSGGLLSQSGTTASGMLQGTSSISMEDLEAWYTETLESDGFTIERSSINMNGMRNVVLQNKKEGIDTLMVTFGDGEGQGQTTISVVYNGPKE